MRSAAAAEGLLRLFVFHWHRRRPHPPCSGASRIWCIINPTMCVLTCVLCRQQPPLYILRTHLEGLEDADPPNLAHHVVVARLEEGRRAGEDVLVDGGVEAVQGSRVDGVAEHSLVSAWMSSTAYGVAAPVELGPAADVVDGLPVVGEAEPVHDLGVRLDAFEEGLGVEGGLG